MSVNPTRITSMMGVHWNKMCLVYTLSRVLLFPQQTDLAYLIHLRLLNLQLPDKVMLVLLCVLCCRVSRSDQASIACTGKESTNKG